MENLKSYVIGLGLTENQADKAIEMFYIYQDLLIETNKLYNLTAITTPEEIELKHFIDSVSAYKYISGNVLDVGAGAGFPCIPLAIIAKVTNSAIKFTAVDSLNKRVLFLNTVINKLQLNAVAIHSRAEDLPKNVLYNTVVARAVSQLNVLCEYTLPFVCLNGRFIAYKAGEIENELTVAKQAINCLGGKCEAVNEFLLPNSDINRKLVIIKKVKHSPEIYPRGKNQPKLNPIT